MNCKETHHCPKYLPALQRLVADIWAGLVDLSLHGFVDLRREQLQPHEARACDNFVRHPRYDFVSEFGERGRCSLLAHGYRTPIPGLIRQWSGLDRVLLTRLVCGQPLLE